jgi:hypothetical protein
MNKQRITCDVSGVLPEARRVALTVAQVYIEHTLFPEFLIQAGLRVIETGVTVLQEVKEWELGHV